MSEETTPKPALTRVSSGEHWSSPPAVLYLDDVEEIYRLFERVSTNVALQLDGYELASPAAASELKSTETRDLKIHSGTPYATFEARPGEFSFYISDREDLVLIGLRDATKHVLNKRRLWAPSRQWPFLIVLLPGWLILLLPLGDGRPVASIVLTVAGLVVYWVLGGIYLRNRFYRSGKVFLRDSRSKPSFWRANQRDLVLIVATFILTVVGAVIAGVILYALGLVGNSPPV